MKLTESVIANAAIGLDALCQVFCEVGFEEPHCGHPEIVMPPKIGNRVHATLPIKGLHTGDLSKSLDCVTEGEAFLLHQEGDGISTLSAAEAMETPVLAYMEARRTFLMEGAPCHASPIEIEVSANEAQKIDSRFQIIKRVSRENCRLRATFSAV